MVLGLAVSEGAHFECDGNILHGLACLFDVLAASAGCTSHSEQYSFFSGSQFRAASLYHAIKPTGSEHRFTGDVAGLCCELRPFQVCACCRPVLVYACEI